MAPAVRCTILGTAPCTLREASAFMKRYAASDFLPSDGVTSSYVHTVGKALRQKIAREKEVRKQTRLLLSTNLGPEGSQLKSRALSIVNRGDREQGTSQGHGAVAGTERRKVREDPQPSWNDIRKNGSVASVDGVENKTGAMDDGKSANRKKRKRQKIGPVENGLAATVTEGIQGDLGEARKLAWDKVRQPVVDGQDNTPDMVKPSNRKKTKRDKAGVAA